MFLQLELNRAIKRQQELLSLNSRIYNCKKRTRQREKFFMVLRRRPSEWKTKEDLRCFEEIEFKIFEDLLKIEKYVVYLKLILF